MSQLDPKTAFLNQLKDFLNEDQQPDDLLIKHGFRDANEIIQIVTNGLNGIKANGLSRIANVRRYLRDLYQYLEEEGYIGNEDDFYDYEYKLYILEDLIEQLKPTHFRKMAGLITTGERIGLRNVTREKRIPPEIEREIIDYIGVVPKGGIKKTKTKTKKNKNKKRITRRR